MEESNRCQYAPFANADQCRNTWRGANGKDEWRTANSVGDGWVFGLGTSGSPASMHRARRR